MDIIEEAHAIQPLGKRALVEVQAVKETTSAGGILIPGSSGPKETYKSEVVSIGPEIELVKIGDLVLISLMAGAEVEHDQQAFRIVHEEEILAIIAR